jgi:hypothetical protein
MDVKPSAKHLMLPEKNAIRYSSGSFFSDCHDKFATPFHM